MIHRYLQKLNKYVLSYNKKIDYGDILYDLEEELMECDVPIEVIDHIVAEIKSSQVDTYRLLRNKIDSVIYNLLRGTYIEKPTIASTIVLFGLQGSGKTTTAMKLAYMLRNYTMIGIDTDRFGAMDQIRQNGSRIGVATICSNLATDPVEYLTEIFTRESYKKLLTNIIIDTAGYSKSMRKDKIITKIIAKITEFRQIPPQAFYVLDATQGHANLAQIRWMAKLVNITGFILTKMDAQSFVGSILSIAYYFPKIPIYYIGYGEFAKCLRRYNLEYTQKRIFGLRQKITIRDVKKMKSKIMSGKMTLLDYYNQAEQGIAMMQNTQLLNLFGSGIGKQMQRMMPMFCQSMNMFKSMTYAELTDTHWQRFGKEPTRIRRLAIGSGQSPAMCRKLLESCQMSGNMMKKMCEWQQQNNGDNKSPRRGKKQCNCKNCQRNRQLMRDQENMMELYQQGQKQ